MPLYVCRVWQGNPTPMEGQNLAWVRPLQMKDYPMPPADKPLVAMLRDLFVSEPTIFSIDGDIWTPELAAAGFNGPGMHGGAVGAMLTGACELKAKELDPNLANPYLPLTISIFLLRPGAPPGQSGSGGGVAPGQSRAISTGRGLGRRQAAGLRPSRLRPAQRQRRACQSRILCRWTRTAASRAS